MKNMHIREGRDHEFKSSWRDEYLRVISAFANSDGGILTIGITDIGHVIGVKGSKKLMEDLPNKMKSKLGIIPLVTLKEIDDKDIIEIIVKPSVHPVS